MSIMVMIGKFLHWIIYIFVGAVIIGSATYALCQGGGWTRFGRFLKSHWIRLTAGYRKGPEPKTPHVETPAHASYKYDVIDGVLWRWDYNEPTCREKPGLAPFCPRCFLRLVSEDWSTGYGYCERCGYDHNFRTPNYDAMVSKARREIERRILTGLFRQAPIIDFSNPMSAPEPATDEERRAIIIAAMKKGMPPNWDEIQRELDKVRNPQPPAPPPPPPRTSLAAQVVPKPGARRPDAR